MLEKYLNSDLVALSTTGVAELLHVSTGVIAVYQNAGATPPADILALESAARKVFASRIRDDLLRKKEEVTRRLAGLQTPEERRKQAETDLAAIEAQLKG